MINRAQDLFLELVQLGGQWNKFNGPKIAADLREKQDLWRAVLFGHCSVPPGPGIPKDDFVTAMNLIPLRDLPGGRIRFDTVVIWPQPNKHDELEQLAAGWSSSELQWLHSDEASRAMGGDMALLDPLGDPQRSLLSLWWD